MNISDLSFVSAEDRKLIKDISSEFKESELEIIPLTPHNCVIEKKDIKDVEVKRFVAVFSKFNDVGLEKLLEIVKRNSLYSWISFKEKSLNLLFIKQHQTMKASGFQDEQDESLNFHLLQKIKNVAKSLTIYKTKNIREPLNFERYICNIILTDLILDFNFKSKQIVPAIIHFSNDGFLLNIGSIEIVDMDLIKLDKFKTKNEDFLRSIMYSSKTNEISFIIDTKKIKAEYLALTEMKAVSKLDWEMFPKEKRKREELDDKNSEDNLKKKTKY